MRTVPPALQAKLDQGVTTLCRCWIVTRADGVVLGFTDHDEDIALGGVTCRAGTGFAASEATSRYGLAVDGAEVSGALADETLNEADLAGGRFDAARIVSWLVDWSEPGLKIHLSEGVLGEVRREGQAFTAELRGLADRLAQENGRYFTARCGADLGDARCGVDLSAGALIGAGEVDAVPSISVIVVQGLDGFAAGSFTAGRLTWTSGANAGLAVEIKEHRVGDDGVRLSLWSAMPEAIAAGDAFSVTAGCDKLFSTCRDRFGNGVNFRGFPHIPGNDFVMQYASAGDGGGNDGSSLEG
ncbi:MAG: DUF2163 domain-containing protein [Xanthobacteraceae bacterium]|nr:MAG: DUF2163 domain-containing protein [Xanthobacteraceae bacterium]